MAGRSVTVDGFTVKETVFGKVVVAYACPECDEILRSSVSDIGNNEDCPNCECSFVVPGRTAYKKYLSVVQEEQDTEKKAAENQIQRQKDAEESDGCLGIALLLALISFVPPLLPAFLFTKGHHEDFADSYIFTRLSHF